MPRDVHPITGGRGRSICQAAEILLDICHLSQDAMILRSTEPAKGKDDACPPKNMTNNLNCQAKSVIALSFAT
jgi:hypothetical protein